MGNPLKALLQRGHIHPYSAFAAEYERHARKLDLPVRADPPTKVQYYRWVAGRNKTLPRPQHCAVLESMFPGWTAGELFGFDEHTVSQESESSDFTGILSDFRPGVDPALLSGLWCSGYILNGQQHHVDLAMITATADGVRSTNYPPEPRFEGHATGHRTDMAGRLFNRHLMGHWRNANDAYYFGSVHLIVLPGEMVLDGFYTGFLDDSEVVSQPWRWIRVDPASHGGVDLSTVTLLEPCQLYTRLSRHTRFDGPLSLSDVVENS